MTFPINQGLNARSLFWKIYFLIINTLLPKQGKTIKKHEYFFNTNVGN